MAKGRLFGNCKSKQHEHVVIVICVVCKICEINKIRKKKSTNHCDKIKYFFKK